MTARAPLGPLLRAFFADHLLQQKAVSPQTIHAYRDAFRRLLTCIRLAGDSSTNTGRNSRNGLGTLEVPNGNGAVNCIGSIGASPLRVTIPAWVGRS